MLQFFVRGIDILGLGELTASKFLKSLGESNTSRLVGRKRGASNQERVCLDRFKGKKLSPSYFQLSPLASHSQWKESQRRIRLFVWVNERQGASLAALFLLFAVETYTVRTYSGNKEAGSWRFGKLVGGEENRQRNRTRLLWQVPDVWALHR